MLKLSVSDAYELYRNNPISVYNSSGELYEPHTMIGEADVSALSPEEFENLWGSLIFLSAAEASMQPAPNKGKRGRKKKAAQ